MISRKKNQLMTRINIALIGPGLVGKEFLNQIKAFKHSKIELKVIAVMSSKAMKLSYDGLEDFDLTKNSVVSSVDDFIKFARGQLPCVVVDCTSSEQIASLYPSFLNDLHLVTPNKKGFSSSLELFDKIRSTSFSNGTFALHESTVGAGLPILRTLNDLVLSGDEIVKIEGIFSGTLSYIFNQYSKAELSSSSFSDIVKEAKALGYTEPDPRDDLNGIDVARKVEA